MPHSSLCVAVALQRYIDFTPVALRQRDLALILAREWGAAVHVLSVDAPVPLLPDVETTREKLERYVDPLLAEGLSVSVALREGRPSREIVAYLEEVGADLLVVGTHAKRGPLDVGLGSTAASLPHDLRAAVVLVRPTVADEARTRELMIPRYPIVFPYG